MVLQHPLTSFPFSTLTKKLQSLYPPRPFISIRPTQVNTLATAKISDQNIVRRSANYGPPIWDYDYVQGLKSEFMGEAYTEEINKLKQQVKAMLSVVDAPLEQLELIDTSERLGISYHFVDEVNEILEDICNKSPDDKWKKNNLYATALEFRLLRQHGYYIHQEVFNVFKDEMGNFKACLCEDTKGMLCLYEASYLSIEGECVLEEARNFTTKYLQEYVKCSYKDEHISVLVSSAFEMPLQWRVPRVEARRFIDAYERREDMNPVIQKLAKLDYNKVQSIYQEDLKYVSSWWRGTKFGEKLSFGRDRIMENFMWTIGVEFKPQLGYFRRMLTKINALITTIDDMYDVYGTLDELDLFTHAVERWKIDALDQLPYYMKMCFLLLHNTVNELAFDALKDQGVHIIHYLKKAWVDLCKSYLLEAKWYYSSYTPTLQEYMENAWISISAPLLLVHAYVFAACPIKKEVLDSFQEYPNIIRYASMILRLADDLGTSPDEVGRGDLFLNQSNVT